MAVQALKPDYPIQQQAPQLPETGFVRIWDIVGDKNATPPIPARVPVSRSTWLNGVKSGKYPKAVKLSERTTAWKVQDIRYLIDSMGAL